MVRLHPKAKSETGKALWTIIDIAFYSLIISVPLVLILGYFIPSPNYPTNLYAFDQSLIQVIDWRLFVTLVLAEVPIGVFLWILFDRGNLSRQLTQDAVSRLRSKNEYRHLQVHRVNEWPEAGYPVLAYYVVNLKTKHAYYAQEEIYRLEKDGIIEARKWRSKEDLDMYFAVAKITLEPRNPRIEELYHSESEP